MKNLKREYELKLKEISEIVKSTDMNLYKIEKYSVLLEEIQNFSFKIPIVGPFSAGKSSLLNIYTCKDILPVALGPETAIATEVKYGKPSIKTYFNNKDYEEYPIEEISNIDTNKYTHMDIYLDSEMLKDKNYTLVDMPGLDSGIIEHNKAIMNYLNEGSYFIFLSDCDQGGLKEDTLRFMDELDGYGLQFSVLVNKIDKKPLSQVNEIIEGIREVLVMRGFNNIFVGATSTRQENGLKDFEIILNQIDYKNIFRKKFDMKINIFLEEVIQSLGIRLSNLDLDTSEIDNELVKLEKMTKQIRENLKNKALEIKHSIKTETKFKILKDVEITLNANIKNLTRCIQNNNEDFSWRVNEILRPILVDKLKIELENMYEDLATIPSDLIGVENICDGIRSGLSVTKAILDTTISTVETIRRLTKKKKKLQTIYKGATTAISVTTSIVAPWLEIILIFLPDILNFFGIGSERVQFERIEKELKSNIIPEIIIRFSSELDSSLEEIAKAMINEKENEIKEEEEIVKNAYLGLLKEKENNKVELDGYREKLERSFHELQSLIIKGE